MWRAARRRVSEASRDDAPRLGRESGTHQSKHAAGRSCRFHGLYFLQNDINTYNLNDLK